MATNLSPVPFLINSTDSSKAGNLIGFNSTGNQPTDLFFREDGVPVTLSVVTPNQTAVRLWDYVDISTALVEMAIDTPDQTPTAGSWEISDGTNVSALLPFNSTASALQTAINALSLVAIPTTVTLVQTGVYLVTGTTNGAIVPLTGLTQSLYPMSVISVIQLQTGSSTQPAVQLIQLSLNPATYQTLTTPLAGAGYTQATQQAGGSGAFNIQLLSFTATPYNGTFTITTPQGTTSALPFNATALQVQTALLALNVAYQNYIVAGNTSGPFTITDTSGNAIAAYTMNVTGLQVPIGFSGLLQLATPGILERFLATTANTITLTLQVRVTYPGQYPITILSIPVNLNRNIIRSGAVYTPSYPTAYSKAQANAFFIQNQSGITGFTGGGATNVDGIATIGTTAGTKIAAVVSGSLYLWNAVGGTASLSSPQQITPTDHATSGIYWNLVFSAAANSNPTDLAVSAAGSSTLARGAAFTLQQVTVSAGSGAYTYALTLGTSGAIRGDVMKVHILLPASANPMINVIGAVTTSIPGGGLVYDSLLEYWFNGTVWYLVGRTA